MQQATAGEDGPPTPPQARCTNAGSSRTENPVIRTGWCRKPTSVGVKGQEPSAIPGPPPWLEPGSGSVSVPVPSPPVLDSVSSPRPVRAAGCAALIKPLPCHGAAWGGPNTPLCTVYLTKLPRAKGGRSEGRPARRACGQQPLTPNRPTPFTVTSRRPGPRPQIPVSAEGLCASEVHSSQPPAYTAGRLRWEDGAVHGARAPSAGAGVQ